jgi:hypothetical protein
VPGRPVEAVPVHVLDDDLVGQADAERQPPADRCGRGERLLRQHGRVARVGRHDSSAQLDPGYLAAGDRQRGERV